jgi:hypothetical protein
MSKIMLATSVSLALGACTLGSGSSPQESVIEANPSSLLVLDGAIGSAASKEVAVSGRDRANVPDLRDWACGQPLREWAVSNVGWLELRNNSASILDVSVEITGLPKTHPSLFVYGTKRATVRDCLTSSLERKLGASSSVVIQPRSSVYLLVSADAATGIYTALTKTEHAIAPE